MKERLLFILLSAFVLVGCNSGEVNTSVNESFSKENYEKAMRDSGKGAELEAEKKREEEYLKGGGQENSQR